MQCARRMLFVLATGLTIVATSQAQIYRIPAVDAEHLDFAQRAESVRQQIPSDSPLLPEETPTAAEMRLAQIPQRPEWAPPAMEAVPRPALSGRRIQIRPKGGVEVSFRGSPRGDEYVGIVNSPTQINIFAEDGGVVEIGADRIVFWTTGEGFMGLGNLGENNAPVEFYLEGNIEFRQGEQLVLAERMYYDADNQSGVILEAEMFAQVGQRSPGADNFPAPFRVKADVLRQFSPSRFQANNAAFTTSRIGVPRYWIQSDALSLDTGDTPLISQFVGQDGDGLGQPQFDRLQVTSENSALYLSGIPVFRWPSFTTDLTRNPSLYLDRIRLGNDSVFGAQALTRWNNFQLLGITPEQDTDWTTSVDYLSDRGLGFGTDFAYQRDNFLGRPASSHGFINAWFINDDGLDNLGEDRRVVPREEDFRGRVRGQHRHITPSGLQITAEVGWISDRNFLEQYYEEEWDLEKDLATSLELKRFTGSGSWGVGANLRLNEFFTQTEWLPRVDHYQVGRSLFANRVTWYEHSQIGYGRFRTAEAPANPVDSAKFDPLAWEVESQGIRAVTRQELDMPFQFGAVKVVPYALGEVAHWQEDLSGSDLTRLLGQAGIRSSLPFWRVDPAVRNELFNLNGLAHKLVLDAEFLWADASEDLGQLPLYDALDDDAIEFSRRRFLFDTFGGTFGDDVPLKYHERTFALRSGMQRFVTSSSAEIADDLMMFRAGLRQRIQTKRGLPGSQRIVDWLSFDVQGSFFPRADRDNFGQEVGPATYDMRWHVGDRTTLLSDGYFDFFGEGLRTVSLGAAISRPGRSQYYAGIRSIEGPISSNVLTSATSYRLSPKWILNYSSSIDFSSTGNIGQNGSIVRIGEALLVSLGAHYDASRDNFGVRFDIAPRFLNSKLGRIGNRPIPPVGAFRLE